MTMRGFRIFEKNVLNTFIPLTSQFTGSKKYFIKMPKRRIIESERNIDEKDSNDEENSMSELKVPNMPLAESEEVPSSKRTRNYKNIFPYQCDFKSKNSKKKNKLNKKGCGTRRIRFIGNLIGCSTDFQFSRNPIQISCLLNENLINPSDFERIIGLHLVVVEK